MGWFEKKLMVVSVEVGFRNISISRFLDFLEISRSRKLMWSSVSELGMSCRFLWMLFVYVGMDSYVVRVWSYISNMSSTYLVYSWCRVVVLGWFLQCVGGRFQLWCPIGGIP